MNANTAIKWDAPDADHPARTASRRSIAAVAVGAKQQWLSLFATDAVVEDPVGPSWLDPDGLGHRGTSQIAHFWDQTVANIANFQFHVADSFVGGNACANVATITSTLADGTAMTIDAVLVYTINDKGLITSLRAHWEPDRALATITPAAPTAPPR
ncbi:nuclear transport factor 2 family protein [Mycobacterium sp. PDNC021]|uniref:nuclear transport factor 2 family protein n=1 Tax=Mycobacterium sp. PDNC021 TaxID=3391399 RepID=UPI003AAD8616